MSDVLASVSVAVSFNPETLYRDPVIVSPVTFGGAFTPVNVYASVSVPLNFAGKNLPSKDLASGQWKG